MRGTHEIDKTREYEDMWPVFVRPIEHDPDQLKKEREIRIQESLLSDDPASRERAKKLIALKKSRKI